MRSVVGAFVGVFVVIVGLVGAVGPASAVDGVLEINQTCATNGGCFSGDTAGWPVTITKSGSYRLTSNLYTVSTATTAVQVATDAVTLDLNGFEISCNAPGSFCLTSGSEGYGVEASSQNDVTIRNGKIRRRALHGILAGDRARVERISVVVGGQGSSGIVVGSESIVTDNAAVGNGGNGISTGEYCTITNNLVQGNGNTGIYTWGSSTAKDNIAAENQGFGIYMLAGATIVNNTIFGNLSGGVRVFADGGVATLIGNTVHLNVGPGFTLSPLNSLAGYANNVLTGNNGNTLGSDTNPEVLGGIQMGTNVCGSDTVCP